MNVRLLVAVLVLGSAAGVVSCSDTTSPRSFGEPIVRSPRGPDKVYVYIPSYSSLECWGAWRWTDEGWALVSECYRMQDGGGSYAYIGTGTQPQINSYCRDDVYAEYCNWRNESPSGTGGGLGPSEWQNLTVPAGTFNDDEITNAPAGGPDCVKVLASSTADRKDKVWCNSSRPDTTKYAGRRADERIRSALANMRQISDTCARRADLMLLIYERGDLHVFGENAIPSTSGTVGGFSPVDAGETGYVGINEVWTKYAWDSNHKTKPKPGSDEPPLSLQNALAHEADHLLGFFHGPTDPGRWWSPNALTCGG